MSTLKISVAMCTYNGGRFLKEQLESILSQTMHPYELVICDDHSQDETIQILEEFCNRAPFTVRIQRNEEQLGYAQNFSQCMQLCTGDVIVLTDQDDIWHLNRIEWTSKAFSANELLTFTYSDAVLINESGQEIGNTLYKRMRCRPIDHRRYESGIDLLETLVFCGGICGCTMAFRASYLPILLPLPTTWIHDWWISMVLSSIGPAQRVSPVVYYRQHASQSIGAQKQESLLYQLKSGVLREKKQYDYQILHYEYALEAALSRAALRTRLAPSLQRKLDFMQRREVIQAGGIKAVKALVTLLINRTYWRLGYGWKPLAKDILVFLANTVGIFPSFIQKEDSD